MESKGSGRRATPGSAACRFAALTLLVVLSGSPACSLLFKQGAPYGLGGVDRGVPKAHVRDGGAPIEHRQAQTTQCSHDIPVIDKKQLPPGWPLGFMELNELCVDHDRVVLYEDAYNPLKEGSRPIITQKELHMKLTIPTSSDAHRHGQVNQRVVQYRPHVPQEECADLAAPEFSNCTSPLFLIINYPYNYYELGMKVCHAIFNMQKAGVIDRRSPLVYVNNGYPLLEWQRNMLQPFSDLRVTTLGDLSSRVPPDTPSASTVEGVHTRCFHKAATIALKDTARFPLATPWETAQEIATYHAPRMPKALGEFLPELADLPDSAMLVAIVVRPPSGRRDILDVPALLEGCSTATPETLLQRLRDVLGAHSGVVRENQPSTRFTSVRCIAHEYGPNWHGDLALARRVDVMVGLHGAGLFNAMFQREGTALVEFRPFEFLPGWANLFMRRCHSWGDEVMWYGVHISTNTTGTPGSHQMYHRHVTETGGRPEDKPYHTYTFPRDRNEALGWGALSTVLGAIAWVGGELPVYERLRNEENILQKETFWNGTDPSPIRCTTLDEGVERLPICKRFLNNLHSGIREDHTHAASAAVDRPGTTEPETSIREDLPKQTSHPEGTPESTSTPEGASEAAPTPEVAQ